MRISDWSSDVCSSDLGPVESLGGGGKAAKDVSATHHDAKLLTALARVRNLLRKPGDRIRIDSELARTHPRLTRKFAQNAGEAGSGHGSVIHRIWRFRRSTLFRATSHAQHGHESRRTPR